ncbi:MAG: hypothetical protein PHV68_00945, partial [Candidatus Gastranaerophilales bacterium]|nr:hypothetical protein [Candidatus Gastranaerophilales bacterium]
NMSLLSDYLQKPFDTKLSILTNIETFSEPYQYLNSPAMNIVIEKLKETYNWVLIDAPPVMAVPDAITIGQNVDGAVLTVGLESTRNNVRKAYKALVENKINVFGVIAREIQSNEAASANEYIKQIISRMMPDEEDVFNEQNKKA